jgi:hypothetical protein
MQCKRRKRRRRSINLTGPGAAAGATGVRRHGDDEPPCTVVLSGDAAFTLAGAAGQDSRASHLTPPGPRAEHRQLQPQGPSLSLAILSRMEPYACASRCVWPCCMQMQCSHTIPPAPPIQCSPLLFGCSTDTAKSVALLARRSRKTRQLSGVHTHIHVFLSPGPPLVFSDESRSNWTSSSERSNYDPWWCHARFVNAGVTIARPHLTRQNHQSSEKSSSSAPPALRNR